jgi:hypothetical protein
VNPNHIKHILREERKKEEPEVDLEYVGLITSKNPAKTSNDNN